jgi:DnaK suppressor protein
MTHSQKEIQRKLQIERQGLSVQLKSGYDMSSSASGIEAQLHIKLQHKLSSIERALQRLEKGTFGVCQGCGNEIDHARLEALPYAEQCIECQHKLERKTIRPYAAYTYPTY